MWKYPHAECPDCGRNAANEVARRGDKWCHTCGRGLIIVHSRPRVQLQFMVVPELLATMAYVTDPVRIKVVDPDAIFLTGLLGESGKKLVSAGIEFYFTRELAEKLIAKGIAERVSP